MKIKNTILVFLFAALLFSCIHRKHKPHVIYYCVAEGTEVRLASGQNIAIEKLTTHDTVLAFDRNKNNFVPSKVLGVAQTEHAGFVQLNFSNNDNADAMNSNRSTLTITTDHPLWVKNKGWCSVQPEITMRVLSMKNVAQLKAGDTCFFYNGKSLQVPATTVLRKIDKVEGIVKAYTIVQLESRLDCFVAADVVIGTEPRQAESGGE